MDMPLSARMEQARAELNAAFNNIVANSGLPAFLLETALLDVLSEVRNRKSLEMLADIKAASKPAEESEAEK